MEEVVTVPRHIKRARRAMIEQVEVIDQPWIIDALIPAIVFGLVLWAGGIAGAIAFAGVR